MGGMKNNVPMFTVCAPLLVDIEASNEREAAERLYKVLIGEDVRRKIILMLTLCGEESFATRWPEWHVRPAEDEE